MTLLRLAVAAATPLAPDEAYYWVWSRALAPGYLDHPPMVALWIRAGTWLAGDNALGIRLFSPLACGLGTWLLVRAAQDVWPRRPEGRRAGLVAAILLNATLLFGIGAVTATPDTPLLLFWTAALAALARVRRTGDARWWWGFGLAAGLALDSKYTAVLLAPSVLAWLLISPEMRPWLRRRAPDVAAAIAAGVFAPVFLWNAGHGWASFAKQGGRAGDWAPGRAVRFLGELVGGQIGFATPLIAVLLGIGTVAAIRAWRDPGWLLLACLTVVPGTVFLQHALGDRVQANWPAVMYPAAAIAAAGLPPRWDRWRAPAAGLGLLLTALIWAQGAAGVLPLPARLDPTLMRVGGWNGLARQIEEAAGREHAAFVASDNYGHASLLARLLPNTIPVLGIDERWALFELPRGDAIIAGRTGLLVRSARRDDAPDPADWARIERIGMLTRGRDGQTAETFRLYRVLGRAGTEPVVVLPRRR